MKTLQDLVDRLNEVDDENEYSLYKIHGKHFICTDDEDDCDKKLSMIMFNIDDNDPTWRIDKNLFLMPPKPQTIAVEFLANSNPKGWLDDDNDDDEIVVDGIQMTKKEADQLYEYFTKKQQEELYKELKKINGDFNKITKLLND